MVTLLSTATKSMCIIATVRRLEDLESTIATTIGLLWNSRIHVCEFLISEDRLNIDSCVRNSVNPVVFTANLDAPRRACLAYAS